MARLAAVLSLAVTGAVAAACSGSAAAREVAPVQTIDVRTRDFAFEAPDTVRAGLTRIRLQNRGSELHHLQLLRIGKRHSFAEFRDSVAAGARLPAWAEPVGGPNVPGTHGSEVLLRLDPGSYAMICLIPSPTDGRSHFRKGMVHSLVVLPSSDRGPAAEPQSDARILLSEYAFASAATLHAGRQVILVENAGSQPHELVLFRFAEGKTPADLLAWASRLVGPPPGEPTGGATEIAPGGVNYVAVNLEPGDYALVCFVSDAADHQSHAKHGMVARIRVS